MATTTLTLVKASALAQLTKAAVTNNTDGLVDEIKAKIPKGDKGDTGPRGVNPRGAFAASQEYAVNDLVTQAGQTYRCTVAHTSSAVRDDSKWEIFAAKGADGASSSGGTGATTVKAWAASTSYVANELVRNGADLYASKAAFTSGATFDATKWDKLTPSTTTATTAPALTPYEAGDGSVIYR